MLLEGCFSRVSFLSMTSVATKIISQPSYLFHGFEQEIIFPELLLSSRPCRSHHMPPHWVPLLPALLLPPSPMGLSILGPCGWGSQGGAAGGDLFCTLKTCFAGHSSSYFTEKQLSLS